MKEQMALVGDDLANEIRVNTYSEKPLLRYFI